MRKAAPAVDVRSSPTVSPKPANDASVHVKNSTAEGYANQTRRKAGCGKMAAAMRECQYG